MPDGDISIDSSFPFILMEFRVCVSVKPQYLVTDIFQEVSICFTQLHKIADFCKKLNPQLCRIMFVRFSLILHLLAFDSHRLACCHTCKLTDLLNMFPFGNVSGWLGYNEKYESLSALTCLRVPG